MLYMYEECLDVFNKMSYTEHALEKGKLTCFENLKNLKEQTKNWKSYMEETYGNHKEPEKKIHFQEKMEEFMTQFLLMCNFDYHETDSIYEKFYEMMKASPWRRMYDNDKWQDHIAQWKSDMQWMGKRLYCIAYYDNPQSQREYKRVQEDIVDTNCEELWNAGAPKFMQRRPPLARPDPFNDENESPLDQTQYDNPSRFGTRTSQLKGLLRGLRTYA